MVNTFLVKMDHDCDGVSCVTYEEHHAEIATLRADNERLRGEVEGFQGALHKIIKLSAGDAGWARIIAKEALK